MKVKKIYFNRKHDQWVGDVIYIEDELDAQGLHVKIMDVEFNNNIVNTIMADFRDCNGGVYSVKGTPDYDKRIVVFKMPLQILSNDGLYEVVFSISYYSQNGNDKLIRTAIQTFTIRDTIESDDETIQQETNYPILVDLVNEISKYKINIEGLITKEDAEKVIKEKIDELTFNIEGVTGEQLTNILLDYVLKEDGKGLSTHDLTDELYNKLINLEGDVDLSPYQTKLDDNLITDSKEIVGGINELKTNIISLSNITSKNTIDINKLLEAVDKPPTFTNPTLSIGLSKTVIEHNTLTNITITPTFRQNDAGGITRYILNRGSVNLLDTTDTQSYIDTISLPHGNSIMYTAIAFFSDGSSKTSNFGVEYPGIQSGSINANNTIRAYANSYYGVIDSDNLIDISLLTSVLNTSKNTTITYNMVNQKSIYMYPKSFGALSSIKDVNNFEYINSYSRNEMEYNGVAYYMYILIDPVEITGFKQTFS